MSSFAYCVKCLEQPKRGAKEFYDFRFEFPVCVGCVVDYGLVPVLVVCPNGEGDPFACEPFCGLCEGVGEVFA
jgi:hypothetical protein